MPLVHPIAASESVQIPAVIGPKLRAMPVSPICLASNQVPGALFSDKDSRADVFAQKRESVAEIARRLAQHAPLIMATASVRRRPWSASPYLNFSGIKTWHSLRDGKLNLAILQTQRPVRVLLQRAGGRSFRVRATFAVIKRVADIGPVQD